MINELNSYANYSREQQRRPFESSKQWLTARALYTVREAQQQVYRPGVVALTYS
ncbi:hypothetical protein J6590_005381 [Homalodisca vitripennis]|nr:hypothetical protein J6590_005381 [Homalodisca vitripennis]